MLWAELLLLWVPLWLGLVWVRWAGRRMWLAELQCWQWTELLTRAGLLLLWAGLL